MSASPLYALKLTPALQVKVWGGRRLSRLLGKALPGSEPYGESWEVHDSVTVANGPLAGRRLGDLARRYGEQLLGSGRDGAAGIPLLAKLIDAQDWLSLQVHPDDSQARALEGEPRGKTEAWLILAAAPGARLVLGLQPGTTRERLANAIRRRQLEALLMYAEVAAGDVLYIPANTVHALGPGLLIYEIQQSSDTTYRLYDWGRLGLDGKPRPLHLEKGIQVANLDALPAVKKPQGSLLVAGDYFRSWRHQLDGGSLQIDSQDKFQCLTCIAGSIRVDAERSPSLQLTLGESALIPACLSAFTLSGSGSLLRSHQSGG